MKKLILAIVIMLTLTGCMEDFIKTDTFYQNYADTWPMYGPAGYDVLTTYPTRSNVPVVVSY